MNKCLVCKSCRRIAARAVQRDNTQNESETRFSFYSTKHVWINILRAPPTANQCSIAYTNQKQDDYRVQFSARRPNRTAQICDMP